MIRILKLLFRGIVIFISICIFSAILCYLASLVENIDLIFSKADGVAGNLIEGNVLRIHAAVIVVLTLILVCVGWIQLGDLNKTSTAEFLLKIDGRYGSEEIIKARAIIQRLYRTANPEDEKTKDEYVRLMSKQIDNIRKETDDKSSLEFAYLINLLDFLETVAFFTRKKYISVRDVDELLGNSVVFYYDVFKSYINKRRERYDNPSYYCELESMVKKMKSHDLKEKLAETCIVIRFINKFS